MFPEKSFNTGELSINYAEGPASGPPLVMLHGLTGRWQNLQPAMEILSSAWHTFALDLRGHGKSGRSGDRYYLVDYVRDTVAFLRKKIKKPAVLFGHSIGGLTAIGAAAELPDKIRALVLLDAPFFIRSSNLDTYPSGMAWFSWVYYTLPSVHSYEDALAKYLEVVPDAVPAQAEDIAMNIYQVAREAVGISLQNQPMAGFDLDSSLSSIKCPILLLWGSWENGAAVREEDVDWFRLTAPHARTIHLPGANHNFLIEQTEVSMGHITAFLKSV